MRLDPEDLIVTSFDIGDQDALQPIIGPQNPTPDTGCRWCPPPENP
ncbi:MAG TPA: hypothetical protein VE871_05260 [Longimicrobium sp.]|nr:hypothetical protein [Longimicrobium sp.]